MDAEVFRDFHHLALQRLRPLIPQSFPVLLRFSNQLDICRVHLEELLGTFVPNEPEVQVMTTELVYELQHPSHFSLARSLPCRFPRQQSWY